MASLVEHLTANVNGNIDLIEHQGDYLYIVKIAFPGVRVQLLVPSKFLLFARGTAAR